MSEVDSQVMRKPNYSSSNQPSQLYQYSSNSENDSNSNVGSSHPPATVDYDYKESYGYIANPSVDFSPANTPYGLLRQPHQPPIHHHLASQTIQQTVSHQEGFAAPLPPPLLHSSSLQTSLHATSLISQSNSYSTKSPREDPRQLKSQSLPELRSSGYSLVESSSSIGSNSTTANSEEMKSRTGSYPLPIYQHIPQQLPEQHFTYHQPDHHHHQHTMTGMQIPMNIELNQYPDMTSLVNSNSNIVVPLVESQFVDHSVCTVCGKRITRDMTRHMRTHQSESRFKCHFPKNQCRHKSGKFNRPYDFKKHLLNRHFKFDEVAVRRLHNLSDKLDHWGTCPCGLRFMGKDWLYEHILINDTSKKCPCIE
ncbi:uncharacterized protein RJT21DRAFT_112745 [Scheffersomyces amazonensis]|uniref:uncharacterized protein n=1 Tax=Scheffersomyces amazonensis TaxID=1078765 RepID=UPI00315D9A93